MLLTPRLRLVPATVELARAEVGDRAAFARLLGAEVPAEWPPETLADALPLFLQWLEAAPPAHAGWYAWYAATRADPATLVASVGFKGPPRDGTVEVGYSVLPQFQRNGFATEMVAGLTRWALAQPGVTRVVAEAEPANAASVAVLRRVGFTPAGPGTEPGHDRYELAGPLGERPA